MQIPSRFTVALHILACATHFAGEYRVTSDFLAGSIHTNPVVVRKILAQLREAGIVTVARGTGGVSLNGDPGKISFLDVYRAVEPAESADLFRFHASPDPDCPVGGNIHALLDGRLRAVQEAMEAEMDRHTLAELETELREILAEKSAPSGGGKEADTDE